MPKISVRMDERGRHAVFSDRTLLMDGLPLDEAENFAAFFRASARFQGGRAAPPANQGRRTARRGGETALRSPSV